jgi:hypothetical protein
MQSHYVYDPTNLGGFVGRGRVGRFCLTRPDRMHDEGGGWEKGIRKGTRHGRNCVFLSAVISIHFHASSILYPSSTLQITTKIYPKGEVMSVDGEKLCLVQQSNVYSPFLSHVTCYV